MVLSVLAEGSEERTLPILLVELRAYLAEESADG
jgi:hypothetical protein